MSRLPPVLVQSNLLSLARASLQSLQDQISRLQAAGKTVPIDLYLKIEEEKKHIRELEKRLSNINQP